MSRWASWRRRALNFVIASAAGLAAPLAWSVSDATAQCAPPAAGATPSNATVTCNGNVLNQNNPDGYGTGAQANDTVNVVTGSVTGTNSGFNLAGGNTINLATGTSVRGGVTGIQVNGTTILNNNNGGTVSVNGAGLNAIGINNSSGTLTINNTGTISATTTAANGFAAAIDASTVTLTNIGGTISANANGLLSTGLFVSNLIITNNTGTIAATGTNTSGSLGIFAINTFLLSANSGTISGADQGIAMGAGGTSANITNNAGGVIKATNAISAAININTGAATSVTVNNAGSITSPFDGVNTNTTTASNITNSGTIGGTGRSGIRVNTATISNTGVVTGLTGIFFRPGNAASTIFNAGTITGTGGTAIQFSVGSLGNTLTLGPGSVIGGAVAGQGSDVLQLGGTGSDTFNLSNIGAAEQYQGFSTFNKIGTSTWTVTGTGNQAWSVQGGTFIVNGTIGGAVNVVGGTLAGNGSVGATTIANGATLSPGSNGIGTLTVNGNLALSAGSLYAIGVAGNVSGRTTVTGSATITGTAQATFQGAAFQNQYTILSAASGRTGTFSNFVVVNLPGFLSASLIYTATEVDLKLTSGLSRIAGLTSNQAAVAQAIDTAIGSGGGFLTGLAGLSLSQIPNALNALSGEGTSGVQETAFGAAGTFLTMMMEQGAFWRSGETLDTAGVSFGPALNYGPEKADAPVFKAMPTKAPIFEPRYRAWAAGFDGVWSVRGETGAGSADLTHRTAGGAAGLDYQINPNLLVGFAGGGSASSFSVPDRATSGTVDGAHLGTYGVATWGSWYAAGTLAFNAFDNRTNRTILGVGPTEMAAGSFTSEMFSGRFEAGFKQAFGGVTVTPFAAVQFAELWLPGYSETSTGVAGTPGVLGLTYASRAASSLPTFLGVQLDTRVTLANGMMWSPYARVSWVHEFEPTREISASFITLPGASFTVDGPRAARDAARIDVGSKLAVTRNAWLFGSFDGEFSDRSQMYAGKGGLKVTW